MSEPDLVRIADPATDAADWREKLARLRAALAALPRAVVAYSGGVDSSVLLRVAHEQLGARSLGVIGVSDSVAARELELALAQAGAFGARIERVATGELSNAAFARNDGERCYHCKRELYRRLAEVASREGGAAVLDGTIADDARDHRPGRRAAAEHAVRSPLAELGFTKADVRAVAAHYSLGSADKPASPCLASRIPYGTPVTREALARVEAAEQVLRELGLTELRVRHHGDVARLEVPVAELQRLVQPGAREAVVARLKALGYRWVALDLEGFRSGSLNAALAPHGAGPLR